ncbi:MAG TPA: hypothetical protein VFE72_10020, partial [Lysobacter sp.]|nr:hypothetical protein [Lysobacter sp.]
DRFARVEAADGLQREGRGEDECGRGHAAGRPSAMDRGTRPPGGRDAQPAGMQRMPSTVAVAADAA